LQDPDRGPFAELVAREKEKQGTQRERILREFRAAGPWGCLNGKLAVIGGLGFKARVQELRQMGYVIETKHEGVGRYRYILISEPAVPKELPKASQRRRMSPTAAAKPPPANPNPRKAQATLFP